MANGSYSIGLLDYSNEKTTVRVITGEITAISLPGVLTEVGNLKTAIDNITLGTIATDSLHVADTLYSSVPPTNKAAQREIKWLITYVDNTATIGVGVPNPGYQKKFSVEAGTADTSLVVNNTDYMDLTASEGLALKTAFDALVKSPYGGAADVISVKLVGRRT
jgi:hypothetical protein